MSNARQSPPTPVLPLSENVTLDDERDIATVYGVKISGVLFRTIGEPTPPGVWLRIVKVEDGVATVEQRTDRAPESETSTPAEQVAFDLKMTLYALLDRDITYDGTNAVLPFESHDQAMNHIAEARRKALRGYE